MPEIVIEMPKDTVLSSVVSFLKLVKNDSGLSIIAIVLIMLMLALVAAVGVSIITTGTGVGIQEEQGMQAFYIAEGGLEKAAFRFKNGTTCTSLVETDTTLGEGKFSISDAISYTPSNTLSAGIDAAVTTIPLTSITGFAPKGRITIESEKIDYYSISGNDLMFAVRGAVSTTAASHLISVSVSQNQCGIKSTGKITTNPLAATIQRVVERYLQSAAVEDCTTCHAASVAAPLCGGGCVGGTRRAMMSEFGSQWSHKRSAGGAVTKEDCGVCHMEGNPTTGATVSPYHEATAGNGYMELRDPKTGGTGIIKTVNFSEPPTNEYSSTGSNLVIKQFSRNLDSATLEEGVKAIAINLCLGCHDGVGATNSAAWRTGGSALNPYASGGTPTNAKAQFDKANSSYHPVRSRQKNIYIDINTMSAPWNQYTKGTARTATSAVGTKWTTPGNTILSDNNYASSNAARAATPLINVDYLTLTNFGFTAAEVPDGVTVVGIRVIIEGNGAGSKATYREIMVSLVKAGALAGTPKAPFELTLTPTDTVITIPDPSLDNAKTDLWGATFTPAEIRATGFGVAIADDDTTHHVLNIDRVQVVVYTTGGFYGDLISCWDCHAPSGATGVQTSTVDAHGSGAATETLRGTIYDPVTNTLCVMCHKSTIYVIPGGGNHGAGSAYVTPSSGQMKPTAAYQGRCNLCHGSATNMPARPIPAEDVHGFNALTAPGGNWPQYGNRPYSFIRSKEEYQNHRPYRSPENTTGSAGCNLAVGAGGGYCVNANMPTTPGDTTATYTPGGVY